MPWWVTLPAAVLFALAVLAGIQWVVYRPDRPLPTIVPGSSSGPAFVVQVIRPRSGLPLGGLLPPQLLGIDGHLGFDTQSPGAAIRGTHSDRIELVADGWTARLVWDENGRVTDETQVVFELMFEDRVRQVRCRPARPAVGSLQLVELPDAGEWSGNFDIELPHCEDAKSGRALDWPPRPLRLHGSFDRFPHRIYSGESPAP